MKVDPQTGIYGYWHCNACYEQRGEASAQDFARLAVGVGAFGELIVWCNRHKSLVMDIENGKIDRELVAMSDDRCEHCDEQGKETMH